LVFSKACEYGIKACIYIGLQSNQGNRVSLKSIAEEIDGPEAFTAKILQSLARTGVVDSLKGPKGGFEISQDRIHEVKLSDIVKAIDGESLTIGCGLGLKACNAEKPCPIHHKFASIRNDLKRILEETSLYELASGLEVGFTFLK